MGFEMKGRWAVVTGASSGIGEAIAMELGRKGCNLILVARREAQLVRVAKSLSARYNVDSEVVVLDLISDNSAEVLAQVCERRGVTIVVNNAGFGMTGCFEKNNPNQIRRMIQLNVLFLAEFTHRMMGYLLNSTNQTRILNVGSVAGCQGVPFFAPYAATKAFINNLSQGLAWEQSGRLKVTCLQPSKTASEFLDIAGMSGSSFTRRNLMSTQSVAQVGVAAMIRGKQSVIPGLINKVMVFTQRFSPPWVVKLVIRTMFKDMA